MGVVVQFDYNAWVLRYPEFASVAQPLATLYFDEATIYHRNDGGGPVEDTTVQSTLLNMLTAHIAARYATSNNKPASPLVGRINNATEGSVTVATDLTVPAGTAQWFAQSKYGLDYWAASAPYRTMRYLRGPRRNFGPIFPGWPTFQ